LKEHAVEHKREKYERLVSFATTLSPTPTPTAVAHPCDQRLLGAVLENA
jgi:phosphate acetyltransferase